MSIADGWINQHVHTLRAVTCPLFSSNSMHAAIIIFITIVLTACLLLLLTLSSLLFYSLRCQKKSSQYHQTS